MGNVKGSIRGKYEKRSHKPRRADLMKNIKMREDVWIWLVNHKDPVNGITSISDVAQVLINCYEEDFRLKNENMMARRDIIEQLKE